MQHCHISYGYRGIPPAFGPMYYQIVRLTRIETLIQIAVMYPFSRTHVSLLNISLLSTFDASSLLQHGYCNDGQPISNSANLTIFWHKLVIDPEPDQLLTKLSHYILVRFIQLSQPRPSTTQWFWLYHDRDFLRQMYVSCVPMFGLPLIIEQLLTITVLHGVLLLHV